MRLSYDVTIHRLQGSTRFRIFVVHLFNFCHLISQKSVICIRFVYNAFNVMPQISYGSINHFDLRICYSLQVHTQLYT